MKKIYLVIFAAFFSMAANSQTSVPAGNVSGTWASAGSPYLVQGAIQIPVDSTLTIEPGVIIEFQGTYKLNVQGRLLAIGTITDTIFFTASDTSTGWRGIRFDNPPSQNDTSKLVYCKLQYGKATGSSPGDMGGALYFDNWSKAIISHCLISGCKANSNGGGIYCTNSSPVISNNTIFNNRASNNYGGGIYCISGSPVIDSNNIIFNAVYNTGNNGFGGGGGLYFEGSSATVTNNTISNNVSYISLWDDYGGGIYCRNSSPLISGNNISNNSAHNYGGGIFCYGSSPEIKDNTISYNTAPAGGGISLGASSNPSISKNLITNNSASSGGGMWSGTGNNSNLSDNIFCNNTATAEGGGIAFGNNSNPQAKNNTVINNNAVTGGGIHLSGSCNPIFTNTIIYGNTASSSGAQVFINDEPSDPGFLYCDIQGGSAAFELNGNFYTGTYQDNIDSVPLFVSPSGGSGNGFDGVAANWTLQSNSPGIDSGDPKNSPYAESDLAGNSRVSGCRIDMGAYERQQSFTFVSSIAITQQICFGGDGTATVSASGGTAYTFLWSNSGTDSSATGLNAGTYSVTVNETSNNCLHIESITLTQPSTLTYTTSNQDVACYGDSTGSAELNSSGGTPPYNYIWSNGATNQNINNLIAGNFSFTITDANNCKIASSISISQPSTPLNIDTITKNDALCYDGTGNATVMVSGGTCCYSYLWSDGNNSQTPSLVAGNFNVTVTDNNGCIQSDSIMINQPAAPISESHNITEPSCFGYSDGAISLSASGGTSPYVFQWSNGAVSEDIDSILSGNYLINITDSNNCSFSSLNIYVSQPSQINSSIDNTPVSCKNGSDGSLNMTVIAGVTPFTFLWSNGAVTEDISSLAAGSYSVTITDNDNCVNTLSYTVIEPPLLSISSFSFVQPTCYGYCNGSAVVNPAGGNGSYAYLWNDFGSQTTSAPTGLCAIKYTVTVTDYKGCSVIDSVTITQPPILQANISKSNVSCFGGGNGSATVTPSGGTPPYNNLWSTGENSVSIANLFAITYSVNVFDIKGCVANNSVTIQQPTPLSLSVSATSNSCFGGASATATANASGGTAPFVYAWSTGDSTSSISNLSAAMYFVTVTDSCGISASDSIIVSEPAALSSSITKTDVNCFGNNNGSATAIPVGGTSPFTFIWNTGATTVSISNLPPSVYFVTITDACSASKTDSVIIAEPALLAVTNITKTNVSCNGGGNGTASVNPTGGSTPYNYNWSNGQTGQTAIGLFSGTYGVNVFDSKGCLASNTVVITQPAQFSASISASDVTCNAGSDGTATVNSSGGTSPYAYNWSTGDTTSSLSGLPSSVYSVTVTDSCGASVMQSVNINEPGGLSTSVTKANVSCNGGTNGSASVSVSGGVTPYSYQWSNPNDTVGTTSSVSGLPSSVYYVTATDNCGQTKIDSALISEPTTLSSLISKTDVSCYGAGDGTATVTPLGGSSPYIYFWSNNQATATAVGLFPGFYSVNVVDANGCLATGNTTITQPSQISVILSASYVTCFTGSDGSATATVTGGTTPYSYLWNDTAATATATANGLPAGTFTVTVSESCGASSVQSISITEPGVLSLVLAKNNVSCNGGTNGSAAVIVSGGVTPYVYQWSNGSAASSISGLPATMYYVTVTDNCTQSKVDSAIITEPTTLNSSISSNNVSCYGSGGGTATVSANGGSSPYTYFWSNNQTTATAVGLFPGFYSVNVVDANGCLATGNTNITQPSQLSAIISASYVSCNDSSDGSANLTVSGGTSPYTFLWSNGSGTQNIASLQAGTYSVTVNDSCGASVIQTVNITEPGALSTTITKTNVSCNGGTNGTASVSVSGGVTPYLFQWSNPNDTVGTTSSLSGLPASVYYVTVTDNCGKTITDSVFISEPALLTSSVVKTDVTCYGLGNGTATVTASGGVSPFTYAWNNGQSNPTAIGLFAGFYSVNVFDANNCLASNSITIIQPATLGLTITKIDATCGSADGEAAVVVSGGASPFSYSWSNGSTQAQITNLVSQTYYITVSDSNACSVSGNVTLGILSLPQPICIVTVDSASTKNLIVWEKNIVSNIDSFKIYRDFSGTLTYLGSVAYEDLSVYTDATQGVNPNVQSYYYRISVLDTCGNESAMSDIHKTIHLANPLLVSQQVELSWDGYQGFNTNFYYRILRKNTGGGSYQVIDSVPSTSFQYTDINPPTGFKDYLIEVVHPDGGCIATKSVENHNSSRSNRYTVSPQGSSLTATTATIPASAGNCDGTAIVTVSGGQSPYTFQWDGNAGSQTADTATGLCPGTYIVTVTDAAGASTFVFATVGVLPGLKSVTDQEGLYRVYPNPNNGNFTIELNAVSKTRYNAIIVKNILGETICHISPEKKTAVNIDLSKPGAGIYLLYLVNDVENSFPVKLIVH